MPNTEIHSSTEKAIAFEYRLLNVGDQVTTVGLTVDSSGFEALEFLMEGGVISTGLGGAFYRIILEESDDGIVFNLVDPEFFITTVIQDVRSDTIIVSNQTGSVAYIGAKRFVRPSIFRFGGAFSAIIDCIGITVIGAKPHHIPAVPLIIT